MADNGALWVRTMKTDVAKCGLQVLRLFAALINSPDLITKTALGRRKLDQSCAVFAMAISMKLPMLVDIFRKINQLFGAWIARFQADKRPRVGLNYRLFLLTCVKTVLH